MQHTWNGLAFAVLLTLLGADSGFAAKPAPPSDVTARDRDDDAGDGLVIEWKLSPDDVAQAKPRRVVKYVISRQIYNQGDFK